MRKQHQRKTLGYTRALPDHGLGRKHDSCSDLPPTQPLDKIFATLSVGRMNKRLVIVILQKVAEPQDPPDKSAGKDCGRHEGKAQNRNRKVKLPSEACEPVMVGSDMQPRLFT